ncbi:MAG TPA: hypothetical protein VLY03_04315 [Bacteroidota bacterium]|nr:hypothetical protein [Bacteroidota bacterium]
MAKTDLTRNILLVCVCAIAFAFVESSVVVYLRALYYPGGFRFPLHAMMPQHVVVEMAREIATIIMLLTIGFLSGRSRWERFAFFLIAFGLWDILYYAWLEVLLHWPASLTDWDILFLVPIPWIAPVIAPIVVSVMSILWGIVILRHAHTHPSFRPLRSSWGAAILGSAIILYTFLNNVNATLYSQNSLDYSYRLFLTGVVCYLIVLLMEWRRPFNQSFR